VLLKITIKVGLSTTISLIQFNINHTCLVYLNFLLVSFVAYYIRYVGVTELPRLINIKYQMAWQLKMAEVHKINTYIIDEQRYLNLELSLSEIAEKFNITSGYLSQLINTHSEQNFNDYINGLHIEASKKMLVEGPFENYTLE